MQEIQALHSRMQQSHEAHMTETNNMKYQMEQMKSHINESANQGSLIQRLTEENNTLKEAVAQAQ